MIKAGIYGPADADSPLRKQLLRLLLRHPDVDLRLVASPAGDGTPLPRLHPLYTGETDLCLERGLHNPAALDVLFVIDEENFTPEARQAYLGGKTAVIFLGNTPGALAGEVPDAVYGFAEWHRKELVRGARAAVCPSPVALLIETALFPLAKNWLLPKEIRAELRAPYRPSEAETAEACAALSQIQSDAPAGIALRYNGHVPFERMDLTLRMPLDKTVAETQEIFRQAYDDHSFVYVIDGNEGIDEDLRGSNKCLMQIYRDGDKLAINASADLQTRSRAGNALHLMNLIFGLYERTGLSI